MEATLLLLPILGLWGSQRTLLGQPFPLSPQGRSPGPRLCPPPCILALLFQVLIRIPKLAGSSMF